jgi:hypothetical protein
VWSSLYCVVIDTKSVRSQLRTLLPLFQDHPEMATILGQKARARAIERYTLDKNVSMLEELYTQVLQRPRLQLFRGA